MELTFLWWRQAESTGMYSILFSFLEHHKFYAEVESRNRQREWGGCNFDKGDQKTPLLHRFPHF